MLTHITYGCCIHCGIVTNHTIGRKWNCGMHAKRFKRTEHIWTEADRAKNRARIQEIYTDGRRR